MAIPINKHDAILRILEFSLIGCRDASLGKLGRLANAEYRLAETVRVCLSVDPGNRCRVFDAIDEYRRCDHSDVPQRADMYAHFLATCSGSPKTESQLVQALPSAALLSILTVGMSRLASALEKEDLPWAAVEADHIHNIPATLDVCGFDLVLPGEGTTTV